MKIGNSDVCEVRGRVIKQGLLSALSAFLLHETRDTPSRVNREVSTGKRIFGLMTGGKKEVHFFVKNVRV